MPKDKMTQDQVDRVREAVAKILDVLSEIEHENGGPIFGLYSGTSTTNVELEKLETVGK